MRRQLRDAFDIAASACLLGMGAAAGHNSRVRVFFHLVTLCFCKTPLGHQYDGQKIQRTDMVWLAVQDFVKSCSLRRSFGY
jgi:hypothetical protein